MAGDCAECRRAAAAGERRRVCAPCNWLDARTQSQSGFALRSDTAATVSPHEIEEACELTSGEELTMLFHLAAIVGERGADVVERVSRARARGNTHVYHLELNRMAAKFVGSLPLDVGVVTLSTWSVSSSTERR